MNEPLIELKELDALLNKDTNQKSIGDLIFPYLIYWKWFLLSAVVALAGALVYLRYAEKIYQVNSTVILRDQKDNKITPANSLLNGMDMIGTVSNVDNEIEVIRSKSLIRNTVNKLNLHTSYMIKGRVKSSDLYTGSPLRVTMSQEDIDKLKAPLTLSAEMNEQGAVTVSRMVGGREEKTTLTTLPALYSAPEGNLTFHTVPGISPQYNTPIEIVIRPPLSVAALYRKNLSVAPTSKTTSVLNMSFRTTEPAKGTDFLNTLATVYNEDAIADKNREALNTKAFIDERIAIIDRELGDAEKNVEQYKKSQGLTDLQSDVQLSLQKGSQYEQQLVNVSTQLNLVDYLDSYVSEPGNRNKPVPSNVGIEDPTLTATVNEYNKLVLERDRLLRTNTETNPVVQTLDRQIEALHASIGTSIASVKEGLTITRNDVRRQLNRSKGQTGMAPTQERQFAEIAREQQIKSALFLMLLQKREENALTLSASVNSAKVLDDASVSGPIAPKAMQVLLAALLLGLLVPALVIFLKDLLHYRIENREDVEKITKLPMLGEIPSSGDDNIAVKENENRDTDEAFRMLRTNLLFMLGKDKKVILVTSTEPKEGKTFVSINCAISLALLGRKVVLVGLDLRLPRISEYMHLDASRGMSQYLSGYLNDVHGLIQPSGIHANLFVIPSGKVPPNPAELISKERLDDAIAVLRKEFDYVVIDSAPVSMVTDSVIAARVADATVFVCRANYSHKTNLRFANDLSDKKMLPSMSLVVNDVTNFRFGYGYGYGYGKQYGYGYGYGKKKKKKRFF